MHAPAAVDHHVGAELTGVLVTALQPASRPEQPRIHRECARRPDPTERTTRCAERSVHRPIGVDEHRHIDLVEAEMAAVRSGGHDTAGERDDRDVGVGEPVVVVAHGGHVFLTGQSSEMAVQHEHHGATAVLRHMPGCSVVIDEHEIGDGITHTDHVRPARARWAVHGFPSNQIPLGLPGDAWPASAAGHGSRRTGRTSATTSGVMPAGSCNRSPRSASDPGRRVARVRAATEASRPALAGARPPRGVRERHLVPRRRTHRPDLTSCDTITGLAAVEPGEPP